MSATEIQCDSCQLLSINGVICHETGCRNARKTWLPDEGEWVRFLECPECGRHVREGEGCDCQEETE